MINKNLNAHYLTENKEINDKYCHRKQYCNSVIYMDEKNSTINYNFLEKYFTLILKLKQVISNVGVNIDYINNLFFNIEYITYICVGHGVSFFKYYLYKDYYGPNNFDKLLIPNSEKLFSIPLKYGWKEENLIKLNLPRWDKFDVESITLNDKRNITSKSIFIMFTWRVIANHKKISSYYINNIMNLINHEQLINKTQPYFIFHSASSTT